METDIETIRTYLDKIQDGNAGENNDECSLASMLHRATSVIHQRSQQPEGGSERAFLQELAKEISNG